MIESLETGEMVKGGRKKEKKKRKNDKATLAVDLKMPCDIEERNDQKDSLKRLGTPTKRKVVKILFLKPRE